MQGKIVRPTYLERSKSVRVYARCGSALASIIEYEVQLWYRVASTGLFGPPHIGNHCVLSQLGILMKYFVLQGEKGLCGRR